MKHERFEDLPVWKTAADLAVQVFAWSSHAWFRGKGDLANQIQRSALSISNNIAEGFECGSTNLENISRQPVRESGGSLPAEF